MAVYQKAFVLLKASPGHEEDVIDELMAIPEVTEAHIVPGDWDILAVLNVQKVMLSPSDETVYSLIMRRISKIKHVQDTNTMVSHFSKTK